MRALLTQSILCLLFLGSLSAQSHLELGQHVLGEITSVDQIIRYTFDANRGDLVWVRMRDVQYVDAHWRLIDPRGSLLEEAWDDGGLAESMDIFLPDTGRYTLEVFDHGFNDTGAFGLSLIRLNQAANGTWLDCYSNLVDSVGDVCKVQTYHFEGEAGDQLSAQMRSHTVHLEPSFFLYNDRGERVGSSKRQGRRALLDLELPESGVYHVFVCDQGGNDIDEIGWSLQLLNRFDCFPQVACGQTLRQSFGSLVARHPYLISMTAGEQGIFQMRSPDPSIEISFQVYNSAGALILEETGSDKMITAELNAETDETFLVLVHDKHGNDLGPYGIHYQSISKSVCADKILCDENYETEVQLSSVAQARAFQMTGEKGQTWYFHLEELDRALEPWLRIYDQYGSMIAEGSHSSDFSIQDTFPHSGMYLALVGDRSGNDIGRIRFSVQAGKPTVDLPDTLQMNPNNPCVVLTPYISGVPVQADWSDGVHTLEREYCGEQEKLGLKVAFAGGCTAYDEVVFLHPDLPCALLDFEQFKPGEILSDQMELVRISAKSRGRGTDLACIFPSSDPPEHDLDLGTPNEAFGGPGKGKGGKVASETTNNRSLGNILIIAENDIDDDRDGLIDDPDDATKGGTLIFEFTREVSIQTLKLIDMEQDGSKIELWGPSNKKLETIPLAPIDDNAVLELDVYVEGVRRMEIQMKGSGAVDEIDYCVTDILADVALKGNPESTDTHAENSKPQISSTNRILDDAGVAYGSYGPDHILFPNPAADMVHLGIDNQVRGKQIAVNIWTITGSKVYEWEAKEAASLHTFSDLGLKPGLYLVEILSESNRAVKKLQIH